MENHQPPKRSLLGAFVRGLVFTALTGALMAGIFSGVGAASFAMGLPFGEAFDLGKTLISMAGIGASTGIFGGLLQTFSAYQHNNSTHAASHNPMRGRDIAVTAVSNNLMQPQMQMALAGKAAQPEQATEIAAETTHHRDRVQSSAVNEKLNILLAGKPSNASFTDRVNASRETTQTARSV